MEVTVVLFLRNPGYWVDDEYLEAQLQFALEEFGEVVEVEVN